MRYIYTLLWYLILPLLFLRLWWRGRKNPGYRQHIGERFGHYDFPSLKQSIWVHAVSLGEIIAVVPLIKTLVKRYPQHSIVVTTMTPTGRDRAKTALGDSVILCYLPYEYPLVINRFIKRINPNLVIITEMEIWPNLLYCINRYHIPAILANARLSAKSFQGYKKLPLLFKPTLFCFTMILAQSNADKERFLALGVKQNQIMVSGNVKFDLEIPADLIDQTVKLRSLLGDDRLIWVAASTHDGEEVKLLRTAKVVLEQIPTALLILVPRHPERFDDVLALCQKEEFNVTPYRKLEQYSATTDILLGDVMGKLLLFYGVGDVAFVGGSLISWGGHNILEPAALAKPVLSGDSLHAFAEIKQIMLDRSALVIVNNELELAEKLIALFKDKTEREQLGTVALDIVEKHRGSTEKTLEVIKGLVATDAN